MKKILFAAILFFLSGKIVLSQPAGWQYTMPVQVTELSGNTLYNYQLAITINTQALIGAGQMDSSGNDIRFKSSCMGANLNYWIEAGINTAATLIWVRIDTLPANSTKTIFMFYGNPAAAAASSLSAFFGPHSATDSVTVPNTNPLVANSQRGFRFMPNENILVSSFGKNEPGGTTRYVTLFKFAAQTISAQIQISGPAGSYSYAPLPSPLWLIAGTEYTLQLFQGSTDGYFYGGSSQIGQHLTYLDMRYCNSCTQNTFPTSVLNNFHYGLPDLLYYTKSNVTPAPAYSLGSAYQLASVFAGSDTSFCEGGQVQIGNPAANGYPPFSYLWQPTAGLSSDTVASPTASPLITTTYIETVTDSFGCAVSDSITLTVFPLPAVSFSLGLDTICTTAVPFALSGGNPLGGTYSGPGIYSDTLYPDSAGAGTHTINYTYTDSLGCTNSSADSIVIDICTDINDLYAENYFEVYPNPAGSELRIESSKPEIETLAIFDLLGQSVFSQQLTAKSQKQIIVNVSELKPGIYFLKVQTANRTAAEKFVKE